MSMNKYELRAWLLTIIWVVTSACAYPEDYREWFGIILRAVLSCAIGWYIGTARAQR